MLTDEQGLKLLLVAGPLPEFVEYFPFGLNRKFTPGLSFGFKRYAQTSEELAEWREWCQLVNGATKVMFNPRDDAESELYMAAYFEWLLLHTV